MLNLTKSLDYLARAKEIIPVATQTFSKGYRYFPEGVSPIYLQRGEGSHIWDVDGNEYIDYVMALGPITLGYHYKCIDEAIKKQLDDGIIFSLPHPLEVELSELITKVIPCAEMVRFAKNGSDATNAAVKLARAYTGREKIAFRGYHGGNNDWYGIITDKDAGLIRALKDYIVSFEYNNLSSLEGVLKNNDIAGVILEPIIVEFPKDNYLQELIKLSHHYGAIVIFDETLTAGRLALGGTQEYFNVKPDLATLGKGVANGMPLSILVGRRDIMELLDNIFFSFTFGGETLSLAASLATINEMREKNTIKHCWDMGRMLRNGLESLGIATMGYDSRPYLVMSDDQVWKSKLLEQLFLRGVMIHVGGLINICYSHTKEDIEQTLNAFEEVLKIIDKVELHGEVAVPAFRRL